MLIQYKIRIWHSFSRERKKVDVKQRTEMLLPIEITWHLTSNKEKYPGAEVVLKLSL